MTNYINLIAKSIDSDIPFKDVEPAWKDFLLYMKLAVKGAENGIMRDVDSVNEYFTPVISVIADITLLGTIGEKVKHPLPKKGEVADMYEWTEKLVAHVMEELYEQESLFYGDDGNLKKEVGIYGNGLKTLLNNALKNIYTVTGINDGTLINRSLVRDTNISKLFQDLNGFGRKNKSVYYNEYPSFVKANPFSRFRTAFGDCPAIQNVLCNPYWDILPFLNKDDEKNRASFIIDRNRDTAVKAEILFAPEFLIEPGVGFNDAADILEEYWGDAGVNNLLSHAWRYPPPSMQYHFAPEQTPAVARALYGIAEALEERGRYSAAYYVRHRLNCLDDSVFEEEQDLSSVKTDNISKMVRYSMVADPLKFNPSFKYIPFCKTGDPLKDSFVKLLASYVQYTSGDIFTYLVKNGCIDFPTAPFEEPLFRKGTLLDNLNFGLLNSKNPPLLKDSMFHKVLETFKSCMLSDAAFGDNINKASVKIARLQRIEDLFKDFENEGGFPVLPETGVMLEKLTSWMDADTAGDSLFNREGDGLEEDEEDEEDKEDVYYWPDIETRPIPLLTRFFDTIQNSAERDRVVSSEYAKSLISPQGFDDYMDKLKTLVADIEPPVLHDGGCGIFDGDDVVF